MEPERERGRWPSPVGSVLIMTIVAVLTTVVARSALGFGDTVEITVVDEGTGSVVDTTEFTVGEDE